MSAPLHPPGDDSHQMLPPSLQPAEVRALFGPTYDESEGVPMVTFTPRCASCGAPVEFVGLLCTFCLGVTR